MQRLPDLSSLSPAEKDALIRALWAQVRALTEQVATLTARVAELEAKLGVPPKTPDNSSLPPSWGKKPSRDDTPARAGSSPNACPRWSSHGPAGRCGWPTSSATSASPWAARRDRAWRSA